MQWYVQLKLYMGPVHIAVGAWILIAGAWQMIAPKGTQLHRRMGNSYLWGMYISFLTSFPLSMLSENYFLATIGLFSLYLADSGKRMLLIGNTNRVSALDRAGILFFAFSVVWMMLITLYLALENKWTGAFILGIFTGIFLRLVWKDVRFILLGEDLKLYVNAQNRVKHHLGRMIGSYIAATTAFLVNVQPLPHPLLNWLLPTVVGLLFIRVSLRKHHP